VLGLSPALVPARCGDQGGGARARSVAVECCGAGRATSEVDLSRGGYGHACVSIDYEASSTRQRAALTVSETHESMIR
jgi:hypothetical protein